MSEYQTRLSFLEDGNVPVSRKEKKLMFTNSGDRNKVQKAGTTFEI